MKKTFCFCLISALFIVFFAPGLTATETKVLPVEKTSEQSKKPWYTDHPQEAILKVLDPMIEAALQGYNEEKWQLFFADYAESMAGIATEMTFKNMILNMFKSKTGDYQGKKLIPERCSFNDTAPLLVFEGQFAKGKFLLPVNFIKEADKLKIMQIQVQDLPK